MEFPSWEAIHDQSYARYFVSQFVHRSDTRFAFIFCFLEKEHSFSKNQQKRTHVSVLFGDVSSVTSQEVDDARDNQGETIFDGFIREWPTRGDEVCSVMAEQCDERTCRLSLITVVAMPWESIQRVNSEWFLSSEKGRAYYIYK